MRASPAMVQGARRSPGLGGVGLREHDAAQAHIMRRAAVDGRALPVDESGRASVDGLDVASMGSRSGSVQSVHGDAHPPPPSAWEPSRIQFQQQQFQQQQQQAAMFGYGPAAIAHLQSSYAALAAQHRALAQVHEQTPPPLPPLQTPTAQQGGSSIAPARVAYPSTSSLPRDVVGHGIGPLAAAAAAMASTSVSTSGGGPSSR